MHLGCSGFLPSCHNVQLWRSCIPNKPVISDGEGRDFKVTHISGVTLWLLNMNVSGQQFWHWSPAKWWRAELMDALGPFTCTSPVLKVMQRSSGAAIGCLSSPLARLGTSIYQVPLVTAAELRRASQGSFLHVNICTYIWVFAISRSVSGWLFQMSEGRHIMLF